MSKFQIHTIETAPEASQEALKAVKQANGFIPNLIGVLANAPTALETYRTVGGINGRNSLTPLEREVVQITAAVVNGCGFCVAGHTKISLKALNAPKEIVDQIRATVRISDPKLDTLARFTLAVMLQKAKLTEAQLNEFFAAGYNQQSAIEVILGVSLATLCNYANNIAETPINPELQDFA
ncbi:carboxymuconolactone decarboxylase family protein [Actinobacillus pleuropneumoniae]|uniref:Putative macrophage infectivity potentiator-related protein n=1 Tax=Actinobacillus pleuropneumoniae TaxID=715 RepID=A0A3S4ZVP9_ACTPL|nr:carboxymuconolactone decarboxylase family protein [Actinobacillus pleuropneumoniae]EFL78240.1 putative macrophage infectivity potentiator-related protein [Actinobacillus pleuropneumoniae serovar 2 str. 4226]EFM86526.1 Macrophage infectivity potentiator protein [Actinobacillus pleuropneumoniae serovar 2 str. S1536]MEE3619504.1 carboxymuconolactone decarboxylase family protein [Actinobacillus pleuropneumoniae]UKH07360.1 carboxymuconolactone decarboxylase family protein [Actinobacillus pleuropn